jgi:hypothetical protein
MKTIAKTASMDMTCYELRDGLVTIHLSNRWTRMESQQVHEATVTLPGGVIAGFDPMRKMRVTVIIEQEPTPPASPLPASDTGEAAATEDEVRADE